MRYRRPSKPLGRLLARVLEGSWRAEPPRLEVTRDELDQLLDPLLASGAAGLAWRRLQRTDLCHSEAADELHQAYRRHWVQAMLHREEINYVFGALSAAKLDAVLVKGWAVARHYPEVGLRPYGDLDICFRPDEYDRACEVIASLDQTRINVDLHRGISKLDSLSMDRLMAAANSVKHDSVSLTVLSAEDHLRILCTHALRHGLWRPLWLCDIAAAVESRPPGFDWQRCLGDDSREADWITSALGLAAVLLGANIADTPARGRESTMPGWLVSRVLKNWSRPDPELYPPQAYGRPMATYLRDPRGLLHTLRVRWTDPIEASVRMGAPFNRLPRFPFQAGYAAKRAAMFIAGLSRNRRRNVEVNCETI
jgi:hypothetical protein